MDDGSGTTAIDSDTVFGGTAHDLTLVNTPAWSTGKIGGALYFDPASSEYGSRASYTPLNGSTGITICAWVRLDTLGSNDTDDGAIFGKELTSASDELILFWYNYTASSAGDKKYTINFGTGNDTNNRINSVTAATANVWQHVCGGMNGANRYIWLNGKRDNTTTTGVLTTYTGGTASISVGGDLTISSNMHFDGKIDDLRVYNRILNNAEIWDIFQGTAQLYGGE